MNISKYPRTAHLIARAKMALAGALFVLLACTMLPSPSAHADAASDATAQTKAINVGANAIGISAAGWDTCNGQYLWFGSYGGTPHTQPHLR